MLLQGVLCAIAGCWLFCAGGPGFRNVPRSAFALSGLIVVLPVVQLIPLPPMIWHNLPGRDLEVTVLGLVGAQDSWMPWSMSPPRTLASLLALLPPAFLVIMTSALPRSGRTFAMTTVAIVALAALALGAAQVADGTDSIYRFYGRPEGNYVHGFQAGRNLSATVLLVGMIAVSAAMREWIGTRPYPVRPRLPMAILAALELALVLGVLLTGSRAGAVLLAPAIIAVLWISWPTARHYLRWKLLAGMFVAVLAGSLVLWRSGFLDRALYRFSVIQSETRPDIWTDTMRAAWLHFPFGSGMGTFTPMIYPTERLESLRDVLTNRAHNDYLELFLEAGLAGIAVLCAAVGLLAVTAWQHWNAVVRMPRSQLRFAIASLLVVAAHSIVDYPLRSMSLACVVAFCAGLLFPLRQPQPDGASEGQEAG